MNSSKDSKEDMYGFVNMSFYVRLAQNTLKASTSKNRKKTKNSRERKQVTKQSSTSKA
jgi:hypothetical protein